MFGEHRHCGAGDIISLSRDLIRPHDLRVIWLYGQKSIKVNYHPAKFGGYRLCVSGDIMILVCHVIS